MLQQLNFPSEIKSASGPSSHLVCTAHEDLKMTRDLPHYSTLSIPNCIFLMETLLPWTLGLSNSFSHCVARQINKINYQVIIMMRAFLPPPLGFWIHRCLFNTLTAGLRDIHILLYCPRPCKVVSFNWLQRLEHMISQMIYMRVSLLLSFLCCHRCSLGLRQCCMG